jgi:hypothetical protein
MSASALDFHKKPGPPTLSNVKVGSRESITCDEACVHVDAVLRPLSAAKSRRLGLGVVETNRVQNAPQCLQLGLNIVFLALELRK